LIKNDDKAFNFPGSFCFFITGGLYLSAAKPYPDDVWSIDQEGDELVLTFLNNGNPMPYNSIERMKIPELQELGFSRKKIELLPV
jgi:hypothetical protein